LGWFIHARRPEWNRNLPKEVQSSARKLLSAASLLNVIASLSLASSCVKTDWLKAGGEYKAGQAIGAGTGVTFAER
jgi:hypothetical protein